MSHLNDSVDDALHVLRAREWSRPEHRAQLKESLMSGFSGSRSRFRRNALIAASVGLAALGSLGFVAARELGLIHVTLQGSDGSIANADMTPDENGTAIMRVQKDDGSVTEVKVQRVQDGGQQTMSVNVSGGSGTATVTTSTPQ